METILRNLRHYILLPSICLTLDGFGQGVVEMLESNLLYRGYNNRIHLAVGQEATKLTLSSPDAYVYQDGEAWIIRPFENSKIVTIRVNDTGGRQLCEYYYRATVLPEPKIYWGTSLEGSAISRDETLLFCRHESFYMLEENEFNVVEFIVSVEGKTFKGSNNVIPSELTKLLKELPSGTYVHITLKTINKNKQYHENDAFFTLE